MIGRPQGPTLQQSHLAVPTSFGNFTYDCHSERSEESRPDFFFGSFKTRARFLASLGMTVILPYNER
jgi:hypothetical protein